ncbi:MAG: type II toxin-antitoxin system VapC family toxin [Chloroflexi bacterium]|nr:type II toxin-antitoxin system VapC family toxin [Chloroflexota bacterium]
MIYLDTHIVVWLYAGLIEKFSQPVKNLINENEISISPIVHLELQYLFEIHRVKDNANAIITDLSNRIGLQVCQKDFDAIVSQAMAFSWTRDPFDRVIVATAALKDSILVSKDRSILENYIHARW